MGGFKPLVSGMRGRILASKGLLEKGLGIQMNIWTGRDEFFGHKLFQTSILA
jgi:hypothetical protein